MAVSITDVDVSQQNFGRTSRNSLRLSSTSCSEMYVAIWLRLLLRNVRRNLAPSLAPLMLRIKEKVGENHYEIAAMNWYGEQTIDLAGRTARLISSWTHYFVL